jgi:hypothetical protein
VNKECFTSVYLFRRTASETANSASSHEGKVAAGGCRTEGRIKD